MDSIIPHKWPVETLATKLTIDAMHAVVLNLVKIELKHHLLADPGPNSAAPLSE